MSDKPDSWTIDNLDFDSFLSRLKEGDGAAFEALYRRYAARVKPSCFQYVGPIEAEDIWQRTAFKVLKKGKAFSGQCEAQFQSWLSRIARNECLMTLRRRGSRPQTESLEELQEGARIDPVARVAVEDYLANTRQRRHQDQFDLYMERRGYPRVWSRFGKKHREILRASMCLEGARSRTEAVDLLKEMGHEIGYDSYRKLIRRLQSYLEEERQRFLNST